MAPTASRLLPPLPPGSLQPKLSPQLASACTLRLYQENVFRITGLSPNATSAEVVTQLHPMSKAGPTDSPTSSAFSLNPPPDAEQLRAAMARFEISERRVVDEFFWYWPEDAAEAENDAALQAVQAGGAQQAMDLWLQRESGGSVVASHNLAVLFHMFALDWTPADAVADEDLELSAQVLGYWEQSLQRWKPLFEQDVAWDILAAHPSMTGAAEADFIPRLRQMLPLALAQIHAEAALNYADVQRLPSAHLHTGFMRQLCHGEHDAEAMSRLLLGRMRLRVEAAMAKAHEESEASPSQGARLAEELMDRCRPWMEAHADFYDCDPTQHNQLFDHVARKVVSMLERCAKAGGSPGSLAPAWKKVLDLTADASIRERVNRAIVLVDTPPERQPAESFLAQLGDISRSGQAPAQSLLQIRQQLLPVMPSLLTRMGPQSAGAQDIQNEVAASLFRLAVGAHNNEVRDFATAQSAIGLAHKLATDPTLKARIHEDSQVIQANKICSTCHFCSQAEADSACTYAIYMHGNQDPGVLSVSYNRTVISIPCCPSCAKKIARKKDLYRLACLTIGLVGALLFSELYLSNAWPLGLIFGIMTGMILRDPLDYLLSRYLKLNSLKTFPQVTQLLKMGWSLGYKPANTR